MQTILVKYLQCSTTTKHQTSAVATVYRTNYKTVPRQQPPAVTKAVKMTPDLILSYIVPLLFMFVLATILLATFGWSLGVRRLYVRVLLKIFKVKSLIN